MTQDKTQKIVLVSGGFDPVHIGHIRMFNEAKSLGTKLIVILNNVTLNVALPELSQELGANNTDLQWMVDAYALVFGGTLLVTFDT